MKKRQLVWGMRAVSLVTVVALAGMELLSAPALARQAQNRRDMFTRKPASELPPGLSQTLSAAQWKQVQAKRAQEAAQKEKQRPAIRSLSQKEMAAVRGRGPYRNKYFAGTLPWHRSLRDANLCNGNLFKSFTDLQVAPAKGAGLVLQRTYNSQEERIGPFGVGWTHAYDIYLAEDGNNDVPRSDHFGGKHKYHRDADGLYSPPPYLYDELDSVYQEALVNGTITPITDNDAGMDGTVKHYIAGPGNVRYCDSLTDRYGNVTTLTYQDMTAGNPKLLATVTDPSGRTLTFTWTNFGTVMNPIQRITQVQGPSYRVTYEYDANFNLWKTHLDPDGLNRTTTFGYTSVTDVNGTETGLLSSITDPIGNVVSYTYAIAAATATVWVSSVTEPAGVAVGGGTRTHTWYIVPGSFAAGGRYGTTLSVGFRSNSKVTPLGAYPFAASVIVDTQLRKRAYAMDRGGSGPVVTWLYATVYDSANNVTSVTSVDYYPSGDFTHTDNFTYGYFGNQKTHTVTGFSGTETTTYYDKTKYFQKASVTDMNNRTTSLSVGARDDANVGNRGSILSVSDAGSGIFFYTYDVNGRKVSEVNAINITTTFTYGGPTDVQVGGVPVGNLVQVVQDPGGMGHLNRATTMTYDISGRVLNSTDPMGQTSAFAYNTLGQPLTADFPATANSPAETVSYGYGANGRMESVTDNRGTTSLTYEAGSDRVSSVTDPVTGTLTYSYGVMGQRETLTLPDAAAWTYAYTDENATFYTILSKDDPNSLGRKLSSITDDAGRRVDYDTLTPVRYSTFLGTPRAVKFNQTFDAGSNLVSYAQTEYTYDRATGLTANSHTWLTQVKTTWNWKNGQGQWQANTLSQNDYTYDSAGMRLTNQISGSIGGARTETYGYDTLNRLTSVDYGDGQTQSYTFDNMGNRLTKSDSVTGNETSTYNNANMLLTRGASNYTNDLNGNTLTGGGRTNTWDSQNRLLQCVYNGNTSTFTYGADGLRRKSVVNGTISHTLYDNTMPVREQRHVNNNPSQALFNYATYLIGARGPEYRRDDVNSTVRWYLYDGLGSVVGEVDPNGTITSSRKYDVYGSVRSGVNPGGTSKQKFVGSLGHPSEDETGLIYMRARYMDPVTGRFASQDPIRHGRNWYTYARNDPINRVDFSGKLDGVMDLLGLEAENGSAVANAGFGALATVLVIIAGYQAMQAFAVLGLFMAKKQDIQDFEYAIRGLGLSRAERRRVHDEITGLDLTLEEIREVAEGIVAMRRNGQPNEEGEED